jgi:hypothetical protein
MCSIFGKLFFNQVRIAGNCLNDTKIGSLSLMVPNIYNYIHTLIGKLNRLWLVYRSIFYDGVHSYPNNSPCNKSLVFVSTNIYEIS